MRRQILRSVDAHRCRLEVRLGRRVDVRHERLRIAIDEREPGALHLNHQPVAFLERVKDVLQLIVDRRGLAGHEWLWRDVSVAPARAKDIALHELLEARELLARERRDGGRNVGVRRHAVRIDVDHLDDEVGVGAGGRDLERHADLSGEREIVLERRRLIDEHVGTRRGEALILGRIVAEVSERQRVRVRHRLGRIAHVAVHRRSSRWARRTTARRRRAGRAIAA